MSGRHHIRAGAESHDEAMSGPGRDVGGQGGEAERTRCYPRDHRQMLAIAAFGRGLPEREVAREAGTTLENLQKWLREDPVFVSNLQDAVSTWLHGSASRLAGMVSDAITELDGLTRVSERNGQTRLAAVRTVLEYGFRFYAPAEKTGDSTKPPIAKQLQGLSDAALREISALINPETN